MGELEELLDRDVPYVAAHDLMRVSAAIVQFKQPKLVVDIEKEVQLAFESLREKADVGEARFEQVRPVVEQELDPSAYGNSGYSLELEYGNQNLRGSYDAYEVKSEGNSASYATEHAELEEAQQIAHAAQEAVERNKTYVEAAFDVETKNIVIEQKMISIARWWVMCGGKIHFN